MSMAALYGAGTRLMHRLSAEDAHKATINLLKCNPFPMPAATRRHRPALRQKLWGLDFPNPVGLAAGFDKNAEVCHQMLDIGFGFVEAGTVTPKPQAGNDKPRIFRLSEDEGVINRMGFPNEGLRAFTGQLEKRISARGIIGGNIGKNKTSEDATADYVACTRAVAPLVDYLVINVSSPNTPGLRDLQSGDAMLEIVTAVQAAMQESRVVPLLVKIAPDLDDDEIKAVAKVALDSKLDGLIVSNTTLDRPDSLQSKHRDETGGLSGKPLTEKATAVLGAVYKATNGAIPLVGVGGISNAEDAWAKIRAGASLVQLYSALVYQGPGMIDGLLNGMERLMQEQGFASLQDAIGSDHQ